MQWVWLGCLVATSLGRLAVLVAELDSPGFDVEQFSHRVKTEGRLVATRLENSSCPGVHNRVEEFEYFLVDSDLEGDEGERQLFELTTLVDIIIDVDKVTNRLEPWISTSILHR